VEACNRNDFDAARTTHESLLPLAKGLLSLDVNPVPVKTAMAMLGRDSGALRLPLCAPSDAVRRQIGELLKAQGLSAGPQAVRV
jgi:4-hydroxy-tetrahydrodipicolinate synthase